MAVLGTAGVIGVLAAAPVAAAGRSASSTVVALGDTSQCPESACGGNHNQVLL
jgi:hypothetical protein